MSAILNSLNAHNIPKFKLILMILLSKFMVHGVLSDKTYLSLGLLSPLRNEYLNTWYQSGDSLQSFHNIISKIIMY